MNSNSPEVRALVQAFADKLSQVCPWLLFPYYFWNFLLSSTWNPFSALIDWIHFCVYSRVWRSFGMYIRTWMSNCLSVCLLAYLPVSVYLSVHLSGVQLQISYMYIVAHLPTLFLLCSPLSTFLFISSFDVISVFSVCNYIRPYDEMLLYLP